MNPTDAKELEVLQPSAIEAITRAEVDVSIATARKYPRKLHEVKQAMLGFATLDQETAEGCFYTLPRGGKTIEGPSVRLAEIAVSCYGNLQAGARIIAVVPSGEAPHVVVQAVAKDLEKNITISVEKRRRIVKKRSKDTIDEDDINLAANACSAICFRDAVFKVVPLALVKPVFEAARKVAIGDARTLNDRRARCLDTFAKMGVTKERVLAKMEVKSVEDITLDHLQTLIGLHNAIKEGEVNVDEAFAIAQPAGGADGAARPAATPLQRAQAAPAPAAAAPASTPAATPAPAAAPAPAAKRGPGRPRKTTEKFTAAEAAEMRAQGLTVLPEAVEGEASPESPEPAAAVATPAASPQAVDAAELAAMGLAPEQPAPAAATPAAEPELRQSTKPPFQPIAGEGAPLTNLRKLMYDSGVTEEKMMEFCTANKLALGEKTLADFVANGRAAKLVQLAGAWTKIVDKVLA